MKLSRKLIGPTLGATLAAFASGAKATTLLVDMSPAAGSTIDGIWSNNSAGQNFFEEFNLASASNVTGFNIWAYQSNATVGKAVELKIAGDLGGNPNIATLATYFSTIDHVTLLGGGYVIAHATFSPIAVSSGLHWASFTGNNTELSALSYTGGPAAPVTQEQFTANTNNNNHPGIYQIAYTIEGAASGGAVPEPASWALMLTGFGAMGAMLRRRRASFQAA